MNKNEIKNRIEEVEKELAQLRQDLEKEEKGIWKPDEDECEDYYYIDESGDTYETYHASSRIDYEHIEFGNYYKTEEEAKYQANVQKYTNLFRKYIEEHSDLLDWNDDDCIKCFVWYNYEEKCMRYAVSYTTNKSQGTIYASSERILKNAVEFVGEDNVIKYVLGVE